MKISYDPEVDALDIRFIDEKIECEVIHLSDQVSMDIGPKGKVVAIEIIDASELIPGLRENGVKIENLASIKSVGISSVGRGYATAPKLLVFDGVTNIQDTDIDLDYKLGDQQVSILKNTRGLSNVTPTIIPTNATNGVGINTVGFNVSIVLDNLSW